MKNPAPQKASDDNSNPQQGTTSQKKIQEMTTSNAKSESCRSALIIPPNIRDGRKLFVGGLPAGVTNNQFKEFFERFGTILDSVVMIDRETKCSRGFGFVTFEDSSIATEIIHKNMQADSKSKVCIHGKWCEVKASEPKRYNQHQSSGNHHNRGGSYRNNRSRSAMEVSHPSDSNDANSAFEQGEEGFHYGVAYYHAHDGNYYPYYPPYMNTYPNSPYIQEYVPSYEYKYLPPQPSQMAQYPYSNPYQPPNGPILGTSLPQVSMYHNNYTNHDMMYSPAPQTFQRDNNQEYHTSFKQGDEEEAPSPLIQEEQHPNS